MNKKIDNIQIPSDIPTGDMPGDKINIVDGHIEKARIIFPVLIDMINEAAEKSPCRRVVISVSGGSGVGKSGVASVLSYMLNQTGLGSYVMSGDNYPRRIPSANDNERLHIYRQGGMRALRDADVLTADITEEIRSLQTAERDSDKSLINNYDWFGQYLEGGKKSLASYLGSPAEIDFAEVDSILASFKNGTDGLWLKRMGRDEASLWYEKIDMHDTKVLILEWTHGGSEYIKNVDIPILLDSTPEETLEYRMNRGRDLGIDSPFTGMVLDLEQALLDDSAGRARLILKKSGKLIVN